jgi:hypothetical protein
MVWQRNYFEHVVRRGEALDPIRRYIANNPLAWPADEENPERWVLVSSDGARWPGHARRAPTLQGFGHARRAATWTAISADP